MVDLAAAYCAHNMIGCLSHAGMGALGGVWIKHPKAIRPAAVSRSKVADTLRIVLNAELMRPAFMMPAFSVLKWVANFWAKLEGLGKPLVKQGANTSVWLARLHSCTPSHPVTEAVAKMPSDDLLGTPDILNFASNHSLWA